MDLTSIVNLAKGGQHDAVEQLVDLYAPRLFGLLYRMTGSRHQAEDLMQETFVKMLRGLERYHEDGRFESWLFSIAANLARDYLRKQGRASTTTLSSQDEQRDQPFTSGDEGPQEAMDMAEQKDRVQQAVGELSTREQEVISLRFFSEMSFKEIAETLGVPLGTALARAHRALAHLRTRLGSDNSVSASRAKEV